MAKKTVAVYDCSEGYMNRFLKYVSRRGDPRYEVVGFTDFSALEEFLDNHKVRVLLFSAEETVGEVTPTEEELFGIDWPFKETVEKEPEIEEAVYEKLINHKNVGRFVYFGEKRNSRSRIRHINKYQPMKNILSDLERLVLTKREREEIVEEAYENENLDFIGVYDPSNGYSSICKALDIAERLSIRKNTLFIDFDRFPVLAKNLKLDENSSISDLIYYYKATPSKLPEILAEKKKAYRSVDFLRGPEDMEDMEEIKEADWPEFLRALAKAGGYEAMVVYMGEAFRNLENFFASCSRVYLFSGFDEVSNKRTGILYKELMYCRRDDILQKLYETDRDITGQLDFLEEPFAFEFDDVSQEWKLTEQP